MKMSTNEMADIIIKNLCERSFPIFLTTFQGAGFNEADVLGINRNGYIYEFEIKRSRSDFLSEFRNKKYKHKLLKGRRYVENYDEWEKGKKTGNVKEYILIPNRFFFVCEEGLISKDEVPEYAGLIYIDLNIKSTREVKRAKLLHKEKANKRIYERIANILSQRIIYGCSYYTYKLKQHTN